MLYFPIEIQVRILVHLGLKDLNNVQLVCKKLYLLIKEEWFWKEALKERFEIADIGVGDFSTFRKCLGESSATAISELIGCNSFREYYRFKDRLLLKNEMFSHFSEAWEFRKEDDKSFRYCTLTTSSAPFEILGELKGVLAGSYRIKWKIRLERGNYNLKGTTFTATVKETGAKLQNIPEERRLTALTGAGWVTYTQPGLLEVKGEGAETFHHITFSLSNDLETAKNGLSIGWVELNG